MAASISTMPNIIPLSKSLREASIFPSHHTKLPVPLSIRKPIALKYKAKAFSEGDDDIEKRRQHNQPLALDDIWREIQGENDWFGLLDPMDPLMRSELIRYGEMAQACYDAFDYDPYSMYCGSCKYPRHQFFESIDMVHIGYTLTRHLYATAKPNLPHFFKFSRWPKTWSKYANWIGYVAVSDDATSNRLGRRDITVAWRGTVTSLEWITDLTVSLVPVSFPEYAAMVETCYLELYTNKEDHASRFCKYSAREQVLVEVKRLVEKYRGEDEELSITITGHSLGSALAILSAYDIAETGLNVVVNRRVPVTVFSFAGSRVGNAGFKDRLTRLGVKVLRVVNVHDVVPRMPGLVFNEKTSTVLPQVYSHVGVELRLDHRDSPFLKADVDPACAHNLEVHLHLLDGYRGKGCRFVLANGRDIALVNKDSDFLKDHYLVPPYWWQEKNKGMIKSKHGTWVRPERPILEGHPEDIDRYLGQLGGGF